MLEQHISQKQPHVNSPFGLQKLPKPWDLEVAKLFHGPDNTGNDHYQ